MKKEQEFYESELTFRVQMKTGKDETTEIVTFGPEDNAAEKIKALGEAHSAIESVEWTHPHYVKDEEYIPYGEDIETFLRREVAKPLIRWQDSQQLGYEILPNKYFYRYQPPTPASELLANFWRLEKQAETMLKGLAE